MVATDQTPGNQTGNAGVPFLDCSKNSSTHIQNTEQHVVTTLTGDTTTPPLTTATPRVEEGLVRDEQTNEIYLPLTSTVVLKRKQELLYVPLDFENNLTIDALVDSGAFVRAIAHDDLYTIIQKTGRPLGIAPQTIPTPKWAVFLITLVNSTAQRQKNHPHNNCFDFIKVHMKLSCRNTERTQLSLMTTSIKVPNEG